MRERAERLGGQLSSPHGPGAERSSGWWLPGSWAVRDDRAGPIRVFVVDDHEVVRLGLRAFLGATPASSSSATPRTAAPHCDRLDALGERGALPDVVLMDLVMPEPDGIATTALIRGRSRTVGRHRGDQLRRGAPGAGALEAGATGYVLKDADVDEIVERDPGRAPRRGASRRRGGRGC